MKVVNIHQRTLCASADRVGPLVDSLSSSDDRLWPGRRWPPIRFDRALSVGAVGGHGPIRYDVIAYQPGRSITFRFTAPQGFAGTHRFDVEPVDNSSSRLRHVIEMQTDTRAALKWALVIRPLHDALIEDAFDQASEALGCAYEPARWSARVRFLRRILSGRKP